MDIALPHRLPDDRALILPVLLAGVVLWKLPPAGAAALGICLASLFAWEKGARCLCVFLLRSAPLALYWGSMSAASMLLTGEAWTKSWHAGLDACGRMTACFLLGAWLCARCSARRIALAVEWHLRPFFRDSSWKVGMTLAVMLSAMPRMLRSLRAAWDASCLRMRRSSVLRRGMCAALAALRGLSEEAEDIAFALAARSLDGPASWRDTAPIPPLHWAASLGIITMELMLFLL